MVVALWGADGVRDVHNVHLWQMQEREPALDCHVVVTEDGWGCLEEIKRDRKGRPEKRFGIWHSSLEFEHAARAHVGALLYGHRDPGGPPHRAAGSP